MAGYCGPCSAPLKSEVRALTRGEDSRVAVTVRIVGDGLQGKEQVARIPFVTDAPFGWPGDESHYGSAIAAAETQLYPRVGISTPELRSANFPFQRYPVLLLSRNPVSSLSSTHRIAALRKTTAH